jgi:hypothetical protein
MMGRLSRGIKCGLERVSSDVSCIAVCIVNSRSPLHPITVTGKNAVEAVMAILEKVVTKVVRSTPFGLL